uniref:Uncharacterized protein n=1 Tax=Manihot esculenta TaxID=3983 RepID=A0A2C9U557_MANES
MEFQVHRSKNLHPCGMSGHSRVDTLVLVPSNLWGQDAMPLVTPYCRNWALTLRCAWDCG